MPWVSPSKVKISEARCIIKRAGLRYVLTRIVAICRQITQILRSTAWQFNELKEFLAPDKITALVLSSSNIHHILWIAASAPDYSTVAV